MLESRERLEREIGDLLVLIRSEGEGRYACLMDAKGVFLEDPASASSPQNAALRRSLETRRDALFRLPGQMDGEGPGEDLFAEWSDDAFLLAFLNGRVVLVVVCPDAEGLRARIDRPLRVLADRLLRWNSTYRLDEKGRGLFFTTPRLDVVVIGRGGSEA